MPRKRGKSSFAQQHQIWNILGPPENLETMGKVSNAEVMGNDMESLLPADLNFEISDDVLSDMPLPDYGSNVKQNFFLDLYLTVLLILYKSRFTVCKLKDIKYSPTICCFS